MKIVRFLIALDLVKLTLLVPTPAHGQQVIQQEPARVVCADRGVMFSQLAERYGESDKWVGKQPGGEWAVLDRGGDNWTIIAMDAKMACIIGHGKGSTFFLGEPT
jgi:hypothetical protein